jgi:hypothetical protein
MPHEIRPPEPLLVARRALEEILGIIILHDWRWFQAIHSWALHCRLSLPLGPESPIPAETDWYITVGNNYPVGSIHVYPAKVGGIVGTFHHQHYNGNDFKYLPWRSGDICADHPLRQLDRNPWYSNSMDPEYKLATYVYRSIEWIDALSKNDLIRNGEPYELPDFNPDHDVKFAFTEDADTFARWQVFPDYGGLAALAGLDDRVYFVVRFGAMTQQKYILNSWGNGLDDIKTESEIGIWVRLKETPVLPPWQAPANLGELRGICRSQNVDLDEIILKTSPKIRDGKRHFLLVGFSIPINHGDPPSRMHWQALRLPILSYGKKTKEGFRPKERGYRQRDMMQILRDDLRLNWIQSENWDSEQISTRGRLSPPLIEKSVLLIGAGALGSSLAEILTRQGVQDLTICDPDVLQVGNLTRHTLTLSNLNVNKAQSMAARLNLSLPQSRVLAIPESFPQGETNYQEIFQGSQVIIDSTGSDEVLYELDRFAWNEEKEFYSLSLGYGALRLYCFHARSVSFPADKFSQYIQPWLSLEREENNGVIMPMEGIGCWHPVFPARIDDIWMLASAGIKWIESQMESSVNDIELVVFEQIRENGKFEGLRKQKAV